MHDLLFLVLGALFFKGVSSEQAAQTKQIVAVAGGNVVLPCTVGSPANDDNPMVEWSKEVDGSKPAVIFLYRDGCETFGMKDADFQYRTNLIMRELQNGNYSVRISDVRLSDAGTYQCLIILHNGTKEFTKVKLVVASWSEPKLSVVSADGGGVTLECEALCWEPAPLMTILDNEGNQITDEEPTQERDPRGCYNTKLNVTLHNHVTGVVCRVNQSERNESRKAEILLPGFWQKSDCSVISTVSIAVAAAVAGAALSAGITGLILCAKRKKKRSKTDGGKRAQTATESDRSKKSDPNENHVSLTMQPEAENTKNIEIEELKAVQTVY